MSLENMSDHNLGPSLRLFRKKRPTVSQPAWLTSHSERDEKGRLEEVREEYHEINRRIAELLKDDLVGISAEDLEWMENRGMETPEFVLAHERSQDHFENPVVEFIRLKKRKAALEALFPSLKK
jgi:hypothetical protein